MSTQSTGLQHHTVPSFTFTSGDTLDIVVAYKEFRPAAKKTALVPTCFGGQIENTFSFCAGDATSLADHHVIVVAMLGNGESSSPSNTPNFPKSLDYKDQIRAQYALLQHLGVESLDIVVGFSMGGQQAYYWAAMYPDFVRRAVCICGSARTSPHNYAFLEGPVAALTRSSDYQNGAYKERPLIGLEGFARAYSAWLFSADWYRQGLWKKDGVATMAEFMDNFKLGVESWDPEDVLILARQWQKGDVGSVAGGYENTLSSIKARMLIMPCRTDQYFLPEDSEIEMKSLKHATLAVIPSIWGHVAGGGENPDDTIYMDKQIASLLAT